MKILNAEPRGYSSEAREILLPLGTLVERELSREALLEELADTDVLIVRFAHRIDDELFRAAPRLRCVATATTGTDHIDMAAAAARGVEVLCLKGETEFLDDIHATAEHAWGLLLNITRKTSAAFDSVRRGEWDRDRFIGRELHGLRLGVIGCGRIGRKVAGFGRAFSMTVKVYDPDLRSLPEGVELVTRLDELLSVADVITLHVPLTDETRGMIGAPQFTAMKNGAILINTSRGAVIDEAALLAALTTGALGGAALDVMTEEGQVGFLRDHALVQYAAAHENLLITPHIAGAAREAMHKTEIFIARRIAARLSQSLTSRP